MMPDYPFGLFLVAYDNFPMSTRYSRNSPPCNIPNVSRQ